MLSDQVRKNQSFRVVVIGVGHWHAARYLHSLQVLGQRIVGVWDGDPAAAQAVGARLGIPFEKELPQLLEKADPDVIVGMGRHGDIPTLLSAMLESRAALILEKPLGIRSSDVEPLVVKAASQHRFAAVAFPNRYLPIWKTLAELEAAGSAGDRCYCHFRLINGPPDRYKTLGTSWMLDPQVAGGGSLVNLGSHTLDAFIQYAGWPVRVIGAKSGFRAHHERVEDYSLAMLEGPSGVFGTVESGYCFADRNNGDMEWRLVTGQAYMVQRRDLLSVKQLSRQDTEKIETPFGQDFYHHFVADSLERIAKGAPPVAGLEDGFRVLQLTEQIYEMGRIAVANG